MYAPSVIYFKAKIYNAELTNMTIIQKIAAIFTVSLLYFMSLQTVRRKNVRHCLQLSFTTGDTNNVMLIYYTPEQLSQLD